MARLEKMPNTFRNPDPLCIAHCSVHQGRNKKMGCLEKDPSILFEAGNRFLNMEALNFTE